MKGGDETRKDIGRMKYRTGCHKQMAAQSYPSGFDIHIIFVRIFIGRRRLRSELALLHQPSDRTVAMARSLSPPMVSSPGLTALSSTYFTRERHRQLGRCADGRQSSINVSAATSKEMAVALASHPVYSHLRFQND